MGKRASEYQRAYQTSPTRDVDEEYKSNYEYRRLRRSAEMAHRVIEWPDENDENKIDQGNPESKKVESKKPKAENSEKLKTQKTQTSARKLGLEAATQTPEKPTRDVSVNGDVSVTERESRSAAKKRAAKIELTLKAERKPKGTASDPDTKAKVKQKGDEEPEIAKLNLREHDTETANKDEDEKPVPKIDIVELLKGVRTKPAEADSKRKRPSQQKKRVEEPSGRPASASKQRSGRVQALFEVESNRHNAEVTSTKRPFNLYLFGAGDHSRNGIAVKRTYNVSAPHGAVHETALRAAKRRDAERASARRRKRPTQRGSTKAGPDDTKGSVEQNEFQKWMRRETSQWTTEYRSNFKQHDRTEYARNREIAARCSVLRDDEDLLAIALNPNFDAEKNGHSKDSANPNPKVKLNFVPSSARSASARSTSTRSAKSGGSGSSRFVE